MTNTKLEWIYEDEAQLRQNCRQNLAEFLRDEIRRDNAGYDTIYGSGPYHSRRIEGLLWSVHYLREDLLAWATATS